MNTSQLALWAFLGFADTGAVLACDFGSITADELIARDTEAMGGRAAIEAVEAVEVSLHVNNPEFEVDGICRGCVAGPDADRGRATGRV